jgi:hypothetical protein
MSGFSVTPRGRVRLGPCPRSHIEAWEEASRGSDASDVGDEAKQQRFRAKVAQY